MAKLALDGPAPCGWPIRNQVIDIDVLGRKMRRIEKEDGDARKREYYKPRTEKGDHGAGFFMAGCLFRVDE